MGGDVAVGGERFDLGFGPVGVLAVSYRVLPGEGWEPFVLFSGAASVSTVETTSQRTLDEARMTAIDARVAVTAGEVFADTIAPYASLRGFGGPVFWTIGGADVTGGDRYHFQLGVGLLVTAGVFDAFFEVMPLGERSLSAGGAFAF
jgi:hypothetical protein